MQKITYNETIVLNDSIKELLLINIDEKINQSKDNDCIRVYGQIEISGEVNTENGSHFFSHPVDVELFVSQDQLQRDELCISIDDFNYEIIDKEIKIDLIIQIEGIKEIEAYFPANEDSEIFQVNDITTEEDFPDSEREEIIEENPLSVSEKDIIEKSFEDKMATNKESYLDVEKNNKSFLNQIFRREKISKELAFLYHVAKKETTYKEISLLYGIDENELRHLNNNEEIYKDKLVLIPKKK